MRIAYIGQFNRIHDEKGIYLALKDAGHTVYRFQEDGFWEARNLFECEPDIILYAKLKIPPATAKNLFKEAEKHNVKTVCYMPDLYWGLPRESQIIGKDSMFKADLVCSPDGGNGEKWIEHKINHKTLRQGIHHEFITRGEKIDAPPIAFVGSLNYYYPYREKLIKFLTRTYGDKFKHYGAQNSDHVRGFDLNNLYESTKVVIGDSVFSPRYWSNRIYETIGRGGFIIHPMVAGLDEDYTPYKHFVPYSTGDFAGLKEKIDYFLTHDQERDVIRLAGMEHTRQNHTLNHRVSALLKLCADL